MGYWATVAKRAWRETTFFNVLRALPSAIAGIVLALRQGGSAINQAALATIILALTFLLLVVLEFLWRMLWASPPKIYAQSQAEVGRLSKQLLEIQEPKLEILFEPRHPCLQELPRGAGITKLFRVGVRNAGSKTVIDLNAAISGILPCPTMLFPPLPLQAMHDRPDRKTTEVHPSQTVYFDVVGQFVDGSIYLLHTVSGLGHVLPPSSYTVNITAFGRDIPSTSRRFAIFLPTPRLGLQDLLFKPLDEPSQPDS
jgi:hypothetical protein